MKNTTALFFALVMMVSAAAVHADGNPSDLDTSFASPVGSRIFIDELNQSPFDVATDADGNVFIAFIAEVNDGGLKRRPAVRKVTASGGTDLNFGSGSVSIVPVDLPTGNFSSYLDIALASNGDIYLSFPGYGGTPSSWNFYLARVKADGSGLDGSFGFLGLSVAAFDLVSGDDPGDDIPYDMVLQADGSIVVVGAVETVSHGGGDVDFGVARFTTGGALDTSFDGDGKQVIAFDLGGNNGDIPWAVALTLDNRIIIAGQAETGSGHDLVVASLIYTGGLDFDFSTDGRANYEYHDALNNLDAADNRGYAVTTARVSDETLIYIGGTSSEPAVLQPTMDMAVLCVDLGGNPCTGFGSGGWILRDFSDAGIGGIGDSDDSVRNIAVMAEGDLLVLIGEADPRDGTSEQYPALARLNRADGSADTAFGYGGQRYYGDMLSYTTRFLSGTLDSFNRILFSSDYYSSENSSDNVRIARVGTASEIFSDDFESGDMSAWDASTP